MLVVLAHYEVPMFAGGGGTGVVLFFVLSGYLITSLLLIERMGTGRIDLPRFLWRRARRLTPALFVLVIVTCGLRQASWRDGLLVSVHLGNWAAATGLSNLGVLRHTWSLSTEEQFYLLMPLLLIVVGSPRRLRGIVCAGVVLVMAWRVVELRAGAGQMRLEYAFDTRADALLVGAALATLHRRRINAFFVISGGVVLAALTLRPGSFTTWVQVDLSLAALAAAGLVWHAATSPSRLLSHPVLVWAGRRSYSLYLWHPVLIWVAFGHLGQLSWLNRACLLPVTLAVTELSYQLIERRLRAPSSTPRAAEVPADRGGWVLATDQSRS